MLCAISVDGGGIGVSTLTLSAKTPKCADAEFSKKEKKRRKIRGKKKKLELNSG